MTTSAERLSGEGKRARFDATAQSWQADSWRLYDAVGEYKSAVNWIANGLSQMVILPKVWDADLLQYVDDPNPIAWEAIRGLGDQAAILRTWGTNSTVAGEMMMVRVGDAWLARSRAAIEATQDGQFYLEDYGMSAEGGARRKARPRVTDAYRIWLPHGRYAALADTPPQAFLTDLEQLRLLRLVLNAKLNTRLWLNGIWVFGQKVQMPGQATKGTGGRRSEFLTKLQLTIETNIKRRSTAADIAPIFMQVATPDVGDVIKQFYPEVTIDAREAELRKEIRQTLRELLDLPVEMQTSMSDTNHWGSWTITEMNLTYCLLPRAKTLLNGLSTSWYYDRLVEAGMPPADAAKRRLEPDASNLQGAPSSDEVRQLWDRGAVGDTAMRAASRVQEDAKPSEDESVRNLGRKLGIPYLALWGTDVWQKIEDADGWDRLVRGVGRPGIGASDPERAPGVGEPGAPDDPNSEVSD